MQEHMIEATTNINSIKRGYINIIGFMAAVNSEQVYCLQEGKGVCMSSLKKTQNLLVVSCYFELNKI